MSQRAVQALAKTLQVRCKVVGVEPQVEYAVPGDRLVHASPDLGFANPDRQAPAPVSEPALAVRVVVAGWNVPDAVFTPRVHNRRGYRQEVIDLVSDDGTAAGTRVELVIPVEIIAD